MDHQLDNLFLNIRTTILTLIKQNGVDMNALLFDLGIDKETFIKNFTHRINDFSFYLETLSLVENWEG